MVMVVVIVMVMVMVMVMVTVDYQGFGCLLALEMNAGREGCREARPWGEMNSRS